MIDRMHGVKYRKILPNFLVWFPQCGYLVSSEFWKVLPKLFRNCVFPQNFCTGKLGEIMAFHAVMDAPKLLVIFKI